MCVIGSTNYAANAGSVTTRFFFLSLNVDAGRMETGRLAS